MRFTYTESFPKAAPEDTEARLRMIRKIVEDRLADEILKRLRSVHVNRKVAHRAHRNVDRPACPCSVNC